MKSPWLIARYGDLDGRGPGLRLFQVRRFLVADRDRLIGEGLVQPSVDAQSSADGFVLSLG